MDLDLFPHGADQKVVLVARANGTGMGDPVHIDFVVLGLA